MVQKELLERYLNHTATQEEKGIVLNWLTDPASKDQILAFIESAWKEDNSINAKVLPFESVLDEAIRREGATAKVIPLHRTKWFWTAGAAAALLILAAGTLIGYNISKPTAEPKNEWMLTAAHTGRGQRTQLLLNDGSEVFLDANSKLTFAKNMNVQQVVYLEGEALFNIRDNKEPIIIRTKGLETTAKGSQVKISAFPKDSTVTVSVEKGKAEVSGNPQTYPLLKLRIPGKDSSVVKEQNSEMPKTMPLMKLRPVVVKANESVTINKNNGVASMNTYTDEKEGVKEGRLYFNNAGEAEIVKQLEEYFGVAITLNTGGNRLPLYNAEFTNASREEILQHLSEALDLDYFISADHIYLVKRKTRTTH